jgi:hypothetical protein
MDKEEMKMLLKLTEENAKLKTIIKVLRNKVYLTDKKDRSYCDVDEMIPIFEELLPEKELQIISFDKSEVKNE